MYRKARIYYEYNQFEKAIPLFEQVVTKYPKHELAIISANLLIDSFNIPGREQPEEVIRWVDRFTKMPDLMNDQEFAKQIWALKIDSMVVEAKQNEKKKNFKGCGISMWAAADAQPDSPKHAERLYNAGQCFTNARLIGMAVKVRNELIEKHPTDPLAQKALFQIASGYHQLAYYGEAAKNYEQFATKFPGEKEAPTALGNAYKFRVGLGEDANAIDDMHSFIKLYGARKPQEAADVFFQMGEVYEKSNKTAEHIKHLEEYLKQWGSKGSIEKQIFANFKLGEYYWKQSCPQDGVNGACLKIERVAATGRQRAFQDINKKIKDKNKKLKEKGRTQCGPATKSRITIIDRKKPVAKKAQEHFAAALSLYKNGNALQRIPAGPEQGSRAALATYSAAGSVFYQGEQVYEDFLRVKIPDGLEFQPANNFDSPKKQQAKKKRMEEDTKKLLGYLKDKGAKAEKMAGPPDKKGIYDHVLDYKIAHWTIAASARIGQVWANFEDQLLTMPIPKHLKEMNEWGMPEKDMFCDAFVDKAEPLEAKAIQGYQLCLKAATQEQWFNEWSGMCEVELNQLQPSEYPLAAEARPEAGFVSTLITPASVIPELVTIQTKAGPGGAQ
jgi:tetratricopeptide (TPR) repeat protein